MKFKFLAILGCALFLSTSSQAEEKANDISFYAGTFDIIDKEGDDQTSLLGFEHKNDDLFRQTFLGKFILIGIITCVIIYYLKDLSMP